MSDPTAIDGSDGPLVVRRIVVWRRLEPGDVRTPATELAPESPHLEAKIIEVGIAESLHADLRRLWAKRDEVGSIATGWSARYEPAGVLFAIGGSMVVGAWLDYLPLSLLPFASSVAVLGAGIGVWTKAQKKKREREAERRWRETKEREELESLERRLKPRWERYATKLREETGFRADVRVGDIHEADRLVSLDPSRVSHPDTWSPDANPNEVRYGWMYADGRVVEQRAELEDTPDAPPSDAESHGEVAAPRARVEEPAEEHEEEAVAEEPSARETDSEPA